MNAMKYEKDPKGRVTWRVAGSLRGGPNQSCLLVRTVL